MRQADSSEQRRNLASLRMKLSLLILLVISVAFGINSFVSIELLRDNHIESVSDLLLQKLILTSSSLDNSSLSISQNAISLLAVDPNVVEAFFVKEETLVSSTKRSLMGQSLPEAIKFLQQRYHHLNLSHFTDPSPHTNTFLNHIEPDNLIVGGVSLQGFSYLHGGHYGTLYILYSLENSMAKLRDHGFRLLLENLVLAIVIFLGIFFLIDHFVTKKTSFLVRKIEDFNLDQSLESWKIAGNDEISQIGIHLRNLMESTLEQRSVILSRTESLEASKIELEHALRAKDEFLSNMSHEIRTPLNGILGMTEYLQEATPLDQEQQEVVDSVLSSCQLLLAILNDILDYSKIQSNGLSLQEEAINLKQLLAETAKIFSLLAEKKGLTLDWHCQVPKESHLLCDPNRLRQIFFNIINNAIKFTHEGGLTIVSHWDQELGTFEFSVEDTGIGMSKEQIKKVFDPFYQADLSSTKVFGGTGLGLAICQYLVERMGGEISVHSSVGVGSKFKVALNLREDAQQVNRTV